MAYRSHTTAAALGVRMARECAQPVDDRARLVRRKNAKFPADAGLQYDAQRVATLRRPHGFAEQKRHEHRVAGIDKALRKARDKPA